MSRLAWSLVVVLSFLASSAVHAADEVFSWRQCAGQTLRVMLNKHPYTEGIKRQISEFESLTGIDVAFISHPEERYFDRLDEAFEAPSGKPDVFMTGVYQVWDYAPDNRILPLDSFIDNPALTRVGYNIGDFYPGIVDAFRWDRHAGSKLGTGPLWAIPLGFEACTLTYNRELLAKARLSVPVTMEQLVESGLSLNGLEGPDMYGVAARGVGKWNSLHSGYITTFTNYGAKDMEIEDGRLVSRVNSPEAVKVTDLWVRLLRDCGPDDWEYSDWYRCLADLGARRAGILYDSDIVGFFANSPGMTSQSGKLAMTLPPAPPGTDPANIKSNLWVWGLAINPMTENQNAAWLFIQYFTSREFQEYSVLHWQSLNPPRRSVFDNPAFQRVLSTMPGYKDTFTQLVDNTRVYFTPNPHFSDISERWAEVIRDIANGMYDSTQEGMDALKIWMDSKLQQVPVGSDVY